MKGLYSCSTPSKIRISLSDVCCIKTGVFRKIMSCRIVISYWRIQTHHDCSSRRQFSIGQQKVNIPKYLKSSATWLWKHQTSHYSITYCVYPSTWRTYYGYTMLPFLTKVQRIYILVQTNVFTMKTTARPTPKYFSYLQTLKEDVWC
jgi:hypothetical protein